MKLSPLFALAFVFLVQSALAQPEENTTPVKPSAEAVTADIDQAALAVSSFEDIDDDVCWVAPEWREISR